MSLTAHPWLGGLFGDAETAALLSPEREIRTMLRIEAAHARALGAVGRVDPTLAQEAATAILAHVPDMTALHQGTAQDGVVIPALVAGLKADLPERLHPALHKPLTSQDVIDTALCIALQGVVDLFLTRIDGLTATLDGLEGRFGDQPLMARTRMQAALPSTVGARLRAWRAPLDRHRARVTALRPLIGVIQLGGAVGDRRGWGDEAGQVADSMAKELGLIAVPCWQTERDRMAGLAAALAALTGSLGKIGQDVALMAELTPAEVRLAGGGASSAMPHKSNPVLAELLVALARHTATLSGGMQQAMIHEQERSGAAWTLEWLTLPDLVQTAGRALTAAAEMLDRVEGLGTPRA